MLAPVAQLELEHDQFNVKTAFLHDNLDEEIFTSQHVGFETARKDNKVCKLKKITL